MDAKTRRFVRERALERCEYCRMPESAYERVFHVEHIIAKQHGGGDDLENLALACDRSNLYKGPNLSPIDPETNQLVPLFHPRKDSWDEYFVWDGVKIDAKSSIGRATVQLLQMNAPQRLHAREQIGLRFWDF